MTERSIHFTLDFEADLGTAAATRTFEAAARTDRLLPICRELDIPLTVFCEGEILESRFELIEPLLAAGAEVHPHGYDHSAAFGDPDARLRNLERALRVYEQRFGRAATAYRAPNGMIDRRELETLESAGVRYDSSIFPTRFPGRFDHRHFPKQPFRIAGLRLLELPFATTRLPRVPVALSYYQLLGKHVFRTLVRLGGTPDAIVFDFHMHDLVRGNWHRQPGVSRGARLGYMRAQSMRDPAKAFEDVARWFLGRGHRAEPLSALFERASAGSLPEVAWE